MEQQTWKESVSDISVFHKNQSWQRSALLKTENDVVDTLLMSDFPECWAAIVHEKYQSLQKYIQRFQKIFFILNDLNYLRE